MEIKKTITETVELEWTDVRMILKEYFKAKGFEVTSVNYSLKTEYDGYGDCGSDVIDKITITKTTTEKQTL